MGIRLSTAKDCRNAYREILQGYTHVEEKGFYIKHFKEADLGFIDSIYKKCADDAIEKGLTTKKEKLEFLKEEGFWTEEEEEEFLVQSLAVKDAYEHTHKIQDPVQREDFEKTVIVEQVDKLEGIQKQRSELVNPTVESYCEKQLNEFYVYYAIYKDEKLKEPFFKKDDFDELSFLDLADIVRTYNHQTSKFADLNIRVIGVNHFFLNAFFLCDDDPVKFYGKSVLDLTMYQLNIFSRGKFYKSVLAEGHEPPDQWYEEEAIDGLHELAKWYQSSYQKILNDREAQRHQARHAAAQRGRSSTSRRY